MATTTYTVEELESLGMVGVYRAVTEEPKMVVMSKRIDWSEFGGSPIPVANCQNFTSNDTAPSLTPHESLAQGWREVVAGNVYPIGELWDGIDAE